LFTFISSTPQHGVGQGAGRLHAFGGGLRFPLHGRELGVVLPRVVEQRGQVGPGRRGLRAGEQGGDQQRQGTGAQAGAAGEEGMFFSRRQGRHDAAEGPAESDGRATGAKEPRR